MVNIHEQFPIPFNENEPDVDKQTEPELPEIDPQDQDIENYEENLEAQHAEADKIFDERKLKQLEEQHEEEEQEKLETKRREHMKEDRAELNKQYYR